MTSHLEEGRLQELIDGEIPSSELAPVQAHLAQCSECRARLDEARGFAEEAQLLIETIELTDAPVARPHRVPKAAPKPLIRNLAWAATLVVAAGVGYLAREPIVPASPPVVAATDAVADQTSRSAPREEPEATLQKSVPKTAAPESRRATNRSGAGQPSAARERDAGGAVAADDRGFKARPAPSPTISAPLGRLASTDTALRQEAKKLGDTPLKLEEIVTASANQAAPPAAPNRLDKAALGAASGLRASRPAAVEITLQEALRRLNGSLRLIEGLVPVRLEALDPDVRVIYPLSNGELVLSQRLENGKLTYRLTAPEGFPADSLDRLRSRVRE